ncbi:GAF domain-containing protein [Flammeovirga aprica]|uniref:GAF domain-containing protein n=1 Tax=Flammeovirga aprica JL-4 TaxID=694437 RepID=A0A7X9XCK5_9BACT|nr:GAF domain-containing protein [Flammeovirga aprica]NME71830.1 GAF domain-containing protein [Flammeovirga aprica JL-4]
MIIRKTIRFRLGVLFVVNTVLLLSTLALVFLGTRSLVETNELTEQFKKCNSLYTESEIYYKNFLLEDLISAEFYKKRKSTNTVRSISLLDSALFTVEEVRKHMDRLNDSRAKEMEFLRSDMEQLKAQQDFLMRKYLDLGFKDWGMIGNMRSKIHKIEKTHITLDMGMLLTMRRNEKDYLLRGESKYLKLFDESVEEFELEIVRMYQNRSVNDLTEQEVRTLRANLAAYQFGMHKVVDLMKVIGRGQNSGLMKDVSDLQEKINTRLISLSEKVLSNSESYVKWMMITFLAVFILQALILSWFVFMFSRAVGKRFEFLFNITKRINEGKSLVDFKSNQKFKYDEVSEISNNLYSLDEQLQAANMFSRKVTEGDVDVTYDTKFRETPLANDLIQMRDKFRDVQEEEQKRNWVINGMAQFNQLLREKTKSQEEWYDNLLRSIINYIEASQGTFILLKEDAEGKQYLKLMALYAYDKKRYEERQYDLENGLLGQVYKEQKMVYIEDVPDNYVNISSGMGGAKPKCLIILPLIYGDVMYGILEISSFSVLDAYHIDFLKKLSEIIASSIADMDTSRVVIKLRDEIELQKQRIRYLEGQLTEQAE